MDGQQMNPESAIQYVQQVVDSTGVSPQVFVRLGDLAKNVLKDKNLYPQLLREIVNSGIADESELTPELDFPMIISLIAMGGASQKMTGQAGPMV